MKSNKYISLVLPCKDEANALQSVLSKLPKIVDEVIVVDNNSSDKTRVVAKNFGAKVLTEVRTLSNGIGYGFALQKGIAKATGNIIICMDGDGSYPVEKIPQVVSYFLKNEFDFVSCNRLPFKHPQKMSKIRSLGVNILNLAIFALFGFRIKDSLTGMWVFKRSLLEELRFTQGGWNFSLEIKLKALEISKFNEYQIPYKDRVFDQSKQNLLKTGLEHSLYLLKFKSNILWQSVLSLSPAYSK